MRILVVNAGSSSLKLQVLADGELEFDEYLERWHPSDGLAELKRVLDEVGEVDAVGHRVVHGGPRYSGPVLIDKDVADYLDSLTELAPLHQPAALSAIEACRSALPDVPHVACFDTAFHATIPAAAATYALPKEWNAQWSLRRYGFHGLSHQYAAGRAAQMLSRNVEELQVVTAHLGAGASLCAIDCGASVDTTMGFTPLEGLVMATRSGTVDPGLLMWLQESGRVADARELNDALETRSGLAGLSGTSGDSRDVDAAATAGDPDAQLALDVFDHRLAGLTGSMVASLGGLDALVFTGGIGEHSPRVRAALARQLAFLGVKVSDSANAAASADADITDPTASASVVVVTAREDLQIAREVEGLLAAV